MGLNFFSWGGRGGGGGGGFFLKILNFEHKLVFDFKVGKLSFR
jgi:hypothetical protein